DAFAPNALDFDSAEIGEPDLGHIVEDALLRTVLGDTVARAPQAQLQVGSEIASVAVEEREVVVALGQGGNVPLRGLPRVVRGTVLLAADGSDSAVRRLVDLPTTGHRYEQTAIVAHVTSTGSPQSTAWQRFLPGGPLALLPLADGRSSIVWSLPTADAQRLLAASDAEFIAELAVATAGALGELTACSKRVAFPLQALHALKYATERVALLGDAAHTVHPLAGQGMNLGLLDAASIAAVIEDALLAGEDVGDLKVLRRYERQRKGDNLAMLAAFDGLNRLFRLPGWAAPLRSLGLRAVEAADPVKRLLMQKALGLTAGRKHRIRWSRAESQA
ncbi:MAG TPA: FAD-dependent monooxygenase, partial [Gammaproteobacteria bacterium]|nr:FAD-dependent monooxygenase [Gammaproteobacteria bacterium]